MDYDLIVVGGGAGGMAAARAGVRRGARTLLMQDGPIGGDCTFTGCVPSKAIIEAAARGSSFTDAMGAARRSIEAIAATENDEVFRREGIEVLHGWAEFRASHAIDVDGRRLTARRFVVAAAAGPAVPTIEGLRKLDHLTNENVFALDARPAALAVLGGGAIGCELAQAFRRLGSQVTVVEALDMGYFSLLMAEMHGPGWRNALAWNLVPAGIGNMLGGAFLVAHPFEYAFRRYARNEGRAL